MSVDDVTQKLEAAKRYLGYARSHAESLQRCSDEEAEKEMEYFLLTKVAAVQNLIRYQQITQPNAKLHAPSVSSYENVPALSNVFWAWFARNKIAHDFMTFMGEETHDVYFGDQPVIYKRQQVVHTCICFKPLLVPRKPHKPEEDLVSISPPQTGIKPGALAMEVLTFWEFVCQYIVYGTNDLYDYKTLWQRFEESKSGVTH